MPRSERRDQICRDPDRSPPPPRLGAAHVGTRCGAGSELNRLCCYGSRETATGRSKGLRLSVVQRGDPHLAGESFEDVRPPEAPSVRARLDQLRVLSTDQGLSEELGLGVPGRRGHPTRGVFERYNITDQTDTLEAGRLAEEFLSRAHDQNSPQTASQNSGGKTE
jgi:hypothetical protein